MKHFSFSQTPINILNINKLHLSGGVLFKRDDLFYQAGGGSKARMLQYILASKELTGTEVIVTAGGPLSNFNRACALQCASLGIKMHLVCYTEHDREFDDSMNYLLVKLSGVEVTRCKKTEVAETVIRVVKSYTSKGINAKSIYGGGRSLEGIYSYYDAVKELKEQLAETVTLKKVFIACGTGTTTSGISAGLQDFFPGTELHAISVARKKTDEMPIIKENLEVLNEYFNTNRFNGDNICFHDEFILGEYGAVNDDLISTIRDFISHQGILLDPVYSGKAYYGMTKILNNETNQSVLFWHTGAIYTLMSKRHLLNV